MRVESSLTSVSWIPSESVSGLFKAGFSTGATHYDDPPPDVLENLEELHAAERFRFANHLAAWIEVEDGRVTGAGYSGRGYISLHQGRVGPAAGGDVPASRVSRDQSRTRDHRQRGPVHPDHRRSDRGADAPAGRGQPYCPVAGPTVWTTLSLTISTDGSARGEMTGASRFPRHWLYDHQRPTGGQIRAGRLPRVGRHRARRAQPLGQRRQPPAGHRRGKRLERQLSATIMRGGARPAVRKLPQGRPAHRARRARR